MTNEMIVAELKQLSQELAILPSGHSHMNKMQAEIQKLILASQQDRFVGQAPCWMRS